MFVNVLRTLLRIPEPAISRSEALLIARRVCQEERWSWDEPILIKEGLRKWFVWTNANSAGGNASITIDMLSGQVLYAGMVPY